MWRRLQYMLVKGLLLIILRNHVTRAGGDSSFVRPGRAGDTRVTYNNIPICTIGTSRSIGAGHTVTAAVLKES